MKVKELITKLLDYDMDAEVWASTNKEHPDGLGGTVKGYCFEITGLEEWGTNHVDIMFDDWSDDDG